MGAPCGPQNAPLFTVNHLGLVPVCALYSCCMKSVFATCRYGRVVVATVVEVHSFFLGESFKAANKIQWICEWNLLFWCVRMLYVALLLILVN